MTKVRPVNRRPTPAIPSRPPMKMFRPCSWYGTNIDRASVFISWALQEAGRLGFEVEDIESRDRAPHTQTVLSDLMAWYDGESDQASANLYDWKRLELRRLLDRFEEEKDPRPRIEVTAEITKMNNLTVRWYPAGWHKSKIVFDLEGGHSSNQIRHRQFSQPLDFHWFQGDEAASFNSRATNELMFLRGVGGLCPTPIEEYGYYAKFNHDVVDSILICAARAAYEGLIDRLNLSFNVGVLNKFEFETREERLESDLMGHVGTHRVTSWKLNWIEPELSEPTETAEVIPFDGGGDAK